MSKTNAVCRFGYISIVVATLCSPARAGWRDWIPGCGQSIRQVAKDPAPVAVIPVPIPIPVKPIVSELQKAAETPVAVWIIHGLKRELNVAATRENQLRLLKDLEAVEPVDKQMRARALSKLVALSADDNVAEAAIEMLDRLAFTETTAEMTDDWITYLKRNRPQFDPMLKEATWPRLFRLSQRITSPETGQAYRDWLITAYLADNSACPGFTSDYGLGEEKTLLDTFRAGTPADAFPGWRDRAQGIRGKVTYSPAGLITLVRRHGNLVSSDELGTLVERVSTRRVGGELYSSDGKDGKTLLLEAIAAAPDGTDRAAFRNLVVRRAQW